MQALNLKFAPALPEQRSPEARPESTAGSEALGEHSTSSKDIPWLDVVSVAETSTMQASEPSTGATRAKLPSSEIRATSNLKTPRYSRFHDHQSTAKDGGRVAPECIIQIYAFERVTRSDQEGKWVAGASATSRGIHCSCKGE